MAMSMRLWSSTSIRSKNSKDRSASKAAPTSFEGVTTEALGLPLQCVDDMERPSILGPPEKASFYELSDRLLGEYDRVRTQLSEMCAENARLRHHLRQQPREDQELEEKAFCGSRPAAAAAAAATKAATACPRGSSHEVAAAPRKAALPEPGAPESPRPPPGDSPRSEREPASFHGLAIQIAPSGGHPVPLDLLDSTFNQGSNFGLLDSNMPTRCVTMSKNPSEQYSVLSSYGTEQTRQLTPQMNDSEGSGLADVDFGQLELLPMWLKKVRRSLNSQKKSSSFCYDSSAEPCSPLSPLASPFGPQHTTSFRSASMQKHQQASFVLRPNSYPAVAWDAITILFLIWDMVAVPLLAYELPEMEMFSVVELLAAVVWTADIALGFIKGYEAQGEMQLQPAEVARHYLRTWFSFDVTVVSIDWVLLILDNGELIDLVRFSKLRRSLKLVKLARLMKHGRRLLSFSKFVQSEDWLVACRILWLVALLVVINHFISCAWYAIGSMNVFEDQWTSKWFDEEDDFGYRYSTSFHWSVTQFTPASMEVTPRNALERFFNIGIIFFGLVMFSSFVSNMTNSMTYLQKLNREKRNQRETLMNYLAARGISLELRSDILSFIGRKGEDARKRAVHESDVVSLQTVPEVLMERLHVEVHVPVLEVHALFDRLHKEEPAIIYRLCHQAMSERSLFVGEELFRFGARGSRMYFTVSGTSKYTVGYGEGPPVEVGPGKFVSEACLWVNWEHRGKLNACSVCELAELSAAEFQTFATRSRFIQELQSYAQCFAQSAVSDSNGVEFVTDLWGSRLRIMDLVSRAFDGDEHAAENPAYRLMLLFSGNEFSQERLFEAWKDWAAAERQLRMPGLVNAMRRSWRRVRQLASDVVSARFLGAAAALGTA